MSMQGLLNRMGLAQRMRRAEDIRYLRRKGALASSTVPIVESDLSQNGVALTDLRTEHSISLVNRNASGDSHEEAIYV